MNKKFIAFTLAEVLIVASIVGIVGVLTLPNLKKSYGANANKAKVRAAFTKIDSALQLLDLNKVLTRVGNSTNNTNQKCSQSLLTALAENLKLSTNCGTQSNSNYCFTKTAITDPSGYITNSNTAVNNNNCSTAILNDGTEFAVCITSNTAETDATIGNAKRGLIFIDVDGAQKGANTRGQDIFVFPVGEESLELIQNNTYNVEGTLFADTD